MSLKISPFSAFRALSLSRHTTCKAAPRICTSKPLQPNTQTNTQLTTRAYATKPLTSSPSSPSPTPPRAPQPSYDLTFTCTPCSARSTHRISKQGYHSGSVLITCPSCKNRHVISDHLGIFGDRKLTIEDLMREQGMLVKKGTLSEDGNLEFWNDGTRTERKKDGEEKEGEGNAGIGGPAS
ncbi:hypothetical protein OCU04_006603 [Sclerotinia nivalis]|uniref:DNL-type domain-containing protein n=1 Tax=Sclerotinia nivalis TaxID=352851 RepID=A0A9X0AK50_9HELO|nr:hypothetical protein OCU04_006603 [Sclerotinia nivalis]